MKPRPAASAPIRWPRTIWILGWASFFTDLATEMIYPLLPIFLSRVLGAGAVALGAVEGAAEAVASLLKVVSGVWTDRLGRRKPLIVWGYSLSSFARPLIGFATAWPIVLLVRVTDRIGKGIRTSPRDALIADLTSPDQRGRAYGLHRAMDHAGAVVGPLVAVGLMAAGWSMRQVFLWTIVPGAAVFFLLAWAVRDAPVPPQPAEGRWHPDQIRALSPEFKRLLLATFLFTLGNSADAFYLLRLSDAGVSVSGLATLWSVHHLVKSGSTMLGGRLVDARGPRVVMYAGWMVFLASMIGFGFGETQPFLIGTFLVYGLFFGLTEPAQRAWVSNVVAPSLRGTAFGVFHGVIGLAALPASLLFGTLWAWSGPRLAFSVSAGLTVAASLWLMGAQDRPIDTPHSSVRH